MRTFVKFTGVTDSSVLSQIPEGGAAGFLIEGADAARSVSVERAAALVGELPSGVEAWAVVESPAAELVHRLFDEVGVDRIQVYGEIPPELEFLEVHHLVPSLPVPVAGTSGPDPKVPPAEDYSRLHLDAVGAPARDGSASQPDWEICHRMVEQQPGRKVALAGGLTPENVGQALVEVNPWGVDVGVGIEARPGSIDPAKVAAFLAAIQQFESPGTT